MSQGSGRQRCCQKFKGDTVHEPQAFAALGLGQFELRVLAAINRLKATAWGSNLRKAISEDVRREISIAQLYAALSRLERKGLISFDVLDSEPKQGGRSKKVFRLEAPGVRVLEVMVALHAGVLRPSENTNEPVPA